MSLAESKPVQPIQVVLYQDVLCAWSYLADLRLEVVRQELGPLVRWKVRPFPLRVADVPPTERERRHYLTELARARREADPAAQALCSQLWTGGDAPRSSLPALEALEAVRFQGPSARPLLARSLQRAALEQGVNVSRTDVLYELVGRVGLDTHRFETAWRATRARGVVLEEQRLAHARGIRRVPTLVIGGRWMVSGLREVSEYRELILSCLGKVPRSPGGASEQPLH